LGELKKQSLNAIIWDLGGKFSAQIVGLIVSIFLARLLPPEDFGLLAMVMVVIAMSNIFITGGLDMALIQRKEVTKNHYGSVFFINVIIGFFLATLSFLLAEPLANFYNNEQVKPVMQLSSLTFIIYSFGRVKTAHLTKSLKMKVISKGNILSTFIGGILGIILAYNDFGVWSLVFQNLISGLTYNIYIYFSDRWNPKLTFHKESLMELWTFGFRMFLSNFLNIITSKLDNLLIGKLFNDSTLGFYYRAKNTNEYVINFTSSSIGAVFLPVLSKFQNDQSSFLVIFIKLFHLVCFLSFLISGMLFLIGDELIVLMYSETWIESAYYFRVMAIGIACYPTSTMLLLILTSKGNSKSFLRLEILKKVLVFSALGFGFLISVNFYIYLFVIALYISVLFNIWFAAKEVKKSSWLFFNIIMKYISASVLCASVTFLFEKYYIDYNLIVEILIVSIIFLFQYSLICYLFKFKGFNYFTSELKSFIKKQ
jgi:O-antigen/teichoic acid export membrane protein